MASAVDPSHRWDENMKGHRIQVLRIILCMLSLCALEFGSELDWIAWLPVIPWLFLNIAGVLIIVPLFILALGVLGAGGAQADWMPDELIMIACFIIPTIVSLGICHLRRSKRNEDTAENESITTYSN